jgi:hypothetical protein
MFYTKVLGSNEDEDLVDQVSIDEVNKEYLLETGDSFQITDGILPGGYELNSIYVSRLVFDIIVQGIKERGFKEAKYVR